MSLDEFEYVSPQKNEVVTPVKGFADSKNIGFNKNGVLVRVTDKSTWSKVFQNGLSLEGPILEIKNNIAGVYSTKKEQIYSSKSFIECIDEMDIKKIKKRNKYKQLKKIEKEKRSKLIKTKKYSKLVLYDTLYENVIDEYLEEYKYSDYLSKCDCPLCDIKGLDYMPCSREQAYSYYTICECCMTENISVLYHESVYSPTGLFICAICAMRLCCPLCQLENRGEGVCLVCYP